MRAQNLPDIDFIRNILRYDPKTGLFHWKRRSDVQQSWNARLAGKPAIYSQNGNGYLKGYINNKKVFAHRLAWAIYYGEWPVDDIDHINGDRSDNRIANLRAVSRSENLRNSKKSNRNKSGIIGVHWSKAMGQWTAEIMCDGVKERLGFFDNLDDAKEARKIAEKRLNFHRNHGR